MIAAASDTWGIGGRTFLALYGIAAVLAWVLIRRARTALADPKGRVGEPDPGRHPHDLSYLNGGATLAVYSALSAMHLRGTITSSRGVVQSVGRLDPGVDELERSIHRASTSGAHRNRLITHHSVCTVLDASRQRLVAAGLLLSVEQRSRIRRVGLWMAALAVIGLLRLLAAVTDAQPVSLLPVLLAAVTLSAVLLLVTAPRRSAAGDRLLARLRSEQHDLAPSMSPDWTVYGPQGAALGIGIYGTSALWASDPAFADELALQRHTSSDGGGSSYGGDGGSSSSGDGGSSSSCGGGGSSCGGGGGCGGGS